MLQSRLGISSLCVFAFTISAHAADMGRPVYKAPPAPIATFSWTGFYIGGNVGGAWGDFNNSLSTRVENDFFPADALAGINASGTYGGSPSSFTGGGQLGWNYQTGSWVWGLEADFNWLDLEADRRGPFNYTTNGLPYTLNTSLSANWLATVRGRLGYAVDRNLFFVTGGLALAELQTFQHWSEAPDEMTTSSSRVRTGWTVGGGYEFAWVSNWTTKIEYLYSRFAEDYSGEVSSGIERAIFRNSAEFDLHVLRVGLNYKFGDYGKAPVVARY